MSRRAPWWFPRSTSPSEESSCAARCHSPESSSGGQGANETVGPPAILVIPPEREHRETRSGQVDIQTLLIHPRIEAVEFLLDGNRERRTATKPYRTRIDLAHPPREQELEVRGFDGRGVCLGGDRFLLNRLDVPFAVRIMEIRREQAGEYGMARVQADISVPRAAKLERVEFYRGEHLVEALRDFGEKAAAGSPRTIAVESLMEWVSADGFVRIVAKLADGRVWEDAGLLQGTDYQGEIDVQLVQLQVLVTDRNGDPASDLRPEDFEVRENGARRHVEGLYRAGDVPLVLGLAIDSSGSVLPIRDRLIEVSAGFLEAALAPGDRVRQDPERSAAPVRHHLLQQPAARPPSNRRSE